MKDSNIMFIRVRSIIDEYKILFIVTHYFTV